MVFAQKGGANLIPPSPPSPPFPLPGYFLESCISVATLGADTSRGLSADAGARKRVFPAWLLAAEEPLCSPAPGLPQPWAPRRASQWRPRHPQEQESFCVGSHSTTSEKPPPPSEHPPFLSSHATHGEGLCRGDVALVPLFGLLKQVRNDREHNFQGHNLYLWICEVAIF